MKKLLFQVVVGQKRVGGKHGLQVHTLSGEHSIIKYVLDYQRRSCLWILLVAPSDLFDYVPVL